MDPYIYMGTRQSTDVMQLTTVHRLKLTLPKPFDFRLTVAKPAGWHWSTPKETFEGGILWTGILLRDIPVGLKLSAKKEIVVLDIFTKISLTENDREEIRDIVLTGLGAYEDLDGFYAFCATDPVLSRAAADLPGMRIGFVDDTFGSVALAILLQMAPFTRSAQMMALLLEHFGMTIEFDGKTVILWPSARDIAGVDPTTLRKKAMLGYRADRLVGAARYLEKNPLSLRILSRLPEDEALRELTNIPGIGPYSAAIIFGQSMLPIDAWSVVVMSELFFGQTPAQARDDIDRVKNELAGRWGKWSWLAFAYILNDLDNLSKIYPLSRVH